MSWNGETWGTKGTCLVLLVMRLQLNIRVWTSECRLLKGRLGTYLDMIRMPCGRPAARNPRCYNDTREERLRELCSQSPLLIGEVLTSEVVLPRRQQYFREEICPWSLGLLQTSTSPSSKDTSHHPTFSAPNMRSPSSTDISWHSVSLPCRRDMRCAYPELRLLRSQRLLSLQERVQFSHLPSLSWAPSSLPLFIKACPISVFEDAYRRRDTVSTRWGWRTWTRVRHRVALICARTASTYACFQLRPHRYLRRRSRTLTRTVDSMILLS